MTVYFGTMQPGQVIKMFKQCGALLDGHFQLSSGLHSPGYLQCALVLQHPGHASTLGGEIGRRVQSLEPEVVLSPALGGVVIGHEVARALGVRAVFTERRDGEMTLRRGFSLASEERVLVVEDVITTGKSTRETIAVARAFGSNVIGAAAIVNRGDAGLDVGVSLEALTDVSWPAHAAGECPLCADGVPISKPGSRPDR